MTATEIYAQHVLAVQCIGVVIIIASLLVLAIGVCMVMGITEEHLRP